MKALVSKIRKNFNYLQGKVLTGEVYYHSRLGRVQVEGTCLGGNRILVTTLNSRVANKFPIIVNRNTLDLK